MFRTILVVNRQTELLFGYDRDDLVGRPIETLVPESLQKIHPHLAGYFAGPKARTMGAGLQLTARRRACLSTVRGFGRGPIAHRVA